MVDCEPFVEGTQVASNRTRLDLSQPVSFPCLQLYCHPVDLWNLREYDGPFCSLFAAPNVRHFAKSILSIRLKWAPFTFLIEDQKVVHIVHVVQLPAHDKDASHSFLPLCDSSPFVARLVAAICEHLIWELRKTLQSMADECITADALRSANRPGCIHLIASSVRFLDCNLLCDVQLSFWFACRMKIRSSSLRSRMATWSDPITRMRCPSTWVAVGSSLRTKPAPSNSRVHSALVRAAREHYTLLVAPRNTFRPCRAAFAQGDTWGHFQVGPLVRPFGTPLFAFLFSTLNGRGRQAASMHPTCPKNIRLRFFVASSLCPPSTSLLFLECMSNQHWCRPARSLHRSFQMWDMHHNFCLVPDWFSDHLPSASKRMHLVQFGIFQFIYFVDNF